MTFRTIAAVLAGCALCPATAHADVAARYQEMDKNAVLRLEMTVEADDLGNIRIQSSNMSQYFLVRDDILYFVSVGVNETTVMKALDFFEVQREVMDRVGWKEPPDMPAEKGMRFAEMGQKTVAGRVGTAFGLVPDGGSKPIHELMVISKDASLAPIGKAIARANASSVKGMGSMGVVLQMMNAEMGALLEQGAPLRMMSVELRDVAFQPIPADRLSLPARPKTKEEIRAAVVPPKLAPPPTLPPPGL